MEKLWARWVDAVWSKGDFVLLGLVWRELFALSTVFPSRRI